MRIRCSSEWMKGFFGLGAILFASMSWSKPISIDQIEVEGVHLFSQPEIESAFEVFSGEPVDREKIIQTGQNLTNLYRNRGYQKVKIQSNLLQRRYPNGTLQTVLKYKITEGKPHRIAEIRIIPRSDIRGKKLDYWKNHENQFRKAIELKPGDLLDRDKLSEATRQLELVLSSEQLVQSGVGTASISKAGRPLDVAADLAENTEEWVSVAIPIELGDRVTFGFQGNRLLGTNELQDVVDQQMELGLGREYVRLIRERLIQFYESRGFARVEIEVRSYERPEFSERHVTYLIKENNRVEIDSVQFEGNHAFTEKQLVEFFYQLAPPLTQRHYYVRKEVDQAVDFLVEKLKTQGYLFAKKISIGPTYTRQDKAVRILIYLYEGEQTLVRSIRVEGNESVPSPKILEWVGVQENQPFNLVGFIDGLQSLKNYYRDQGYLEMAIQNEEDPSIVQYTNRNRFVDIVLKLVERDQYRVSQITVEGLEKTKTEIVTRELSFTPGSLLTQSSLNESQDRLRRLGIFSGTVFHLQEDPDQKGHKQVRILMEEGTPGRLASGLGVRNDLGLRVFGEVGYGNLWGRNHSWQFDGNVNRRFEDFCVKRGNDPVCFVEYELRLSYGWPWFVVDELSFRPQLLHDRKRYKQFDSESSSLLLTFERPLIHNPQLTAGVTYSLERVREFNASFSAADQTLTIGSMIPRLQLDLRDNPLAPTSGFFSSVSYEFANEFFGSQSTPVPIDFNRLLFRADQFIPIADEVTWYLSFRTGIAKNNVSPFTSSGAADSRVGIPLTKRFTLGGISSLRGFELQELNKQNVPVQGSLTFVNYRSQMDLPFVGKMRFGPFLDAANLNLDRYTLGDVRYGVGFGFHYQTPIGPVNFDWGFKVKPKPGEDPNRFYFSVGVL